MVWKILLDAKGRPSAEGQPYEMEVIDNPVYRHYAQVQRQLQVADPATGLYVQDPSKELAALVRVLVVGWTLPYDKEDPDSLPVPLAVYLLARLRLHLLGEAVDDPFGLTSDASSQPSAEKTNG